MHLACGHEWRWVMGLRIGNRPAEAELGRDGEVVPSAPGVNVMYRGWGQLEQLTDHRSLGLQFDLTTTTTTTTITTKKTQICYLGLPKNAGLENDGLENSLQSLQCNCFEYISVEKCASQRRNHGQEKTTMHDLTTHGRI